MNRVLEDGHFQIGKQRAKWWREQQPSQPDPQLVQGRISLATPRAAERPPEEETVDETSETDVEADQ